MADRPNFFDLLDLDPQITSWPEIERRVKEKKGAWAKESTMGSPKKRQEARRNLDLLPEIRKVLQDPQSRRQEAEDALRRRGAARQAQEKKLEEWLELLKGSGNCSAEQFGKIRSQFAGTFSEQEIRARFAAAGVRVDAEPAGPRPPRERTDFVTTKDIRQNLELLGLANLYEFLGLSPNSPAEALRARAEEIQKEVHRLGHTDVEAAARSRLAGTCRTVFQSEEEKKKYDNHRLLEAVEAIEDQIQAVAADGVLTAQEMDALIRLTANRGVPPDDVREVLAERAAKEGWKVEREPAGPTPAPGGPESPQSSTGNEGEPPAPATADGAGEGSRSLGGLPFYKLAAAGLATLAVAGGAALFWGPPPLNLLAGVLAAGAAAQSAKPPANPNPAPPPPHSVAVANPGSPNPGAPQQTTASGPQTQGIPPGTPATSQPAPPVNPGTTSNFVPPPIPVPVPVTRPQNPQASGTANGLANGSGGTGSSSSVLGDSASRTTVTSPRPAASLPADPEVAVVAVGDPLLAFPLEDELEKALGGEGIGVVSGSPALDALRRHRASSPSISEILATLRADGIHAVVIAQVERGADRELSYYGRRDTSSTSRVKIFAYLVDGHRALSPGWSDQIDYTTASASTEGESAAHRAAGNLANAVRNGWGTLRGASPAAP